MTLKGGGVIFIISFLLSSQAFALPAALPSVKPESFEETKISKENICHILWKYPFISDLSLYDRIRITDLCEILDRLPLEVREKLPPIGPDRE